MKFVLNRNHQLSSTLGHTIDFIKGEPVHVPPSMWTNALSIGAVPEEELPQTTVAQTKEPSDPVVRKAAIFEAFEQLILGAKRESFTGTGVPHAKALTAQQGFVIDNKERDALWQEFRQLGKVVQ